jgi:hypothetical protein
MIMPALNLVENPSSPLWPLLSVQFSAIGSTGILGWTASVIWILLLLLGGWTAWHDYSLRKFKLVLALTIVGQLMLHLVYGNETFLYSLHWLPLLGIIAAMASTSSHRRVVLAMVTVLIVMAGVNNFRQFDLATTGLKFEERGATKTELERLLSNE